MSQFEVLSQGQRAENIVNSSKSEQANIQSAAIHQQPRNDNANLSGGPAAISQRSIYGSTYAQSPADQTQGNTLVYQHKFSTATNPTYEGVAPKSLFQPIGFQSVPTQAEGMSFGRPSFSDAAAQAQLGDQSHHTSHVGASSTGASGVQGADITGPSAQSHYTYRLAL